MAEIRPFRALRYNPAQVSNLLDVVTPPYDVIDEKLQNELYARHPWNFVRLDLTRLEEGETDNMLKYSRAAETLQDWRDKGVMTRDEAPSFYVYHQTFDADGKTVVRKGFICGVRVHDYDKKVVLPHERTLRGPKIDRLELMKATNTQMSQIFLLYNDPAKRVDAALDAQVARDADIDIVTPEDGIRHQIWVVSDEATIALVQDAIADDQLLIADGHHRYETAVAFRDLEASTGEPRPRDYTMAYLANGADPDLIVWPTHRAVHSVAGFDMARWLEAIRPFFDVQELDVTTTPDALEALKKHSDKVAYVVAYNDAGTVRFLLLTLRLADAQAELDALDVVDAARTLDVTVLHDFILAKHTGVDLEAQAQKTNIRYPRFEAEVDQALQDPQVNLVFLMNATPIAQIREVCVTGGFMPQKSTYFYPKVLSGLVVNDLEDF